MRELSLFTGAGGGLLGTHLLGWRPIGYVEFNDYCQRVIRQRIEDGILPNAPIFGDIRAFISEGYAASYTGLVDCITGGFPCQPFSIAGKRAGADDERNMWPATIECIRLVRPKYALLENVPGLLSSGYFGTVLGDLAQSGYDCRWRILSAAEVGAPHKRDRLWIIAHAHGTERRAPAQTGQSDHGREYTLPEEWQQGANGFTDLCETVANADHARLAQRQSIAGDNGEEFSPTQRGSWWEVEPPLGRMVDGYAGRVAELQAAGNAQVASVVATAWHLLTQEAL